MYSSLSSHVALRCHKGGCQCVVRVRREAVRVEQQEIVGALGSTFLIYPRGSVRLFVRSSLHLHWPIYETHPFIIPSMFGRSHSFVHSMS